MNPRLARPALASLEIYVPGMPIQKVKKKYGLRDVIKLASNENPLGPSPKALRAIKENLKNIHYYPEGDCPDLRQALSKKWKVRPECLVFGNGSNELLILLALAFLDPGDEVVFSAESFVVYTTMAGLMGAKAKAAPARQHRHDPERLAGLVTKKTKLLILCNPNNPTGTLLSRGELDFIVASVKRKNPQCLMVFDEAYGEYAPPKDFYSGLHYIPGPVPIIVLKTFSKYYGLAGLRVGYGIAPQEIIGYLEKVRQPFNVDHLAQCAARAALTDASYQKKVLRTNDQGKRFLSEGFAKMGLTFTRTYANFIFVELPISSKIVFEKLMKNGVIVRPVSARHIRVTIGTAGQDKKLLDSLRAVL